MKSLLDTNIILDVLLARQPFLLHSKAVWQTCDDGIIQGYVSESSLTDIYYIARRIAGQAQARNAVEVCLSAFTVCTIDQAVLDFALTLCGSDFEDDVLIATAVQADIDAIVTRNPNDFTHSPIAVYSPESLLNYLKDNGPGKN